MPETRHMRIRPATPAELPALQDIERAAGAGFRDLGMAAIADDEPPALDTLERYRRSGRAWVATDEQDRPVAYLIAEPVDGALHIEQISVHPDFAHRRLGRALLAHADDHAHEEGLSGLTLTTFTDVPWNAPYYERLGFRVLSEPDLTPGLRKIRAHEADLGLDTWPRVCMRRDRSVPETNHRPAARVLCLDSAHRLLLLRWRDPSDGALLWEPPGGGIESGETPLTAARRELVEETGLDPAAVLERSVLVDRDVRWNGKRYTGTEHFFVARFTEERPPLVRTGLLPDEQASLDTYAWIAWSDLAALPDPVEPPQLPTVLGALVPDGPWCDRA